MSNIAQQRAGAESGHPDSTLAADTARMLQEMQHEDQVAPMQIATDAEIDEAVRENVAI